MRVSAGAPELNTLLELAELAELAELNARLQLNALTAELAVPVRRLNCPQSARNLRASCGMPLFLAISRIGISIAVLYAYKL